MDSQIPPALAKRNEADISRIFESYIQFLGDTAKVSVALDIEEHLVKNLAAVEGWDKKLKQWQQQISGDPREFQVQVNRAINFVQAHRLRTVLDKVVGKLHSMTADELIDALTVNTKYGSEVKTRALTDLVKGAEAVQLMTQRALGDTDAERPKSDPNNKGSQIMLSVAAAMQAAGELGISSTQVVHKQLNPPQDDES